MTRKAKIAILVVVIAVLVGGGYLADVYWIEPATSHQAVSNAHPEAPAFTLTDFSGQELSLNRYRGKVILLDFWATWCGPCRMEIPGLVRLQDHYRAEGLQVLGIVTRDQAHNVPAFYAEFRMNYPVAMGNEGLNALYGGILGLPTTFLIGRDGRIYESVVGGVGENYFEPAVRKLLAASAQEEVKDFQPSEGSQPARVETPAEANSPIPGIDVSKLSEAELARYEDLLSKEECTCGCKMNVAECRKKDPGCGTSLAEAQATLERMEGKPVK